MGDYAAELAERWHLKADSVGLGAAVIPFIEGAIREALAKAADSIEDGVCFDLEACKHRDCKPPVEAAAWVRELGAKP